MKTKRDVEFKKAFFELGFMERGVRIYLRNRATAEIAEKGGKVNEETVNGLLFHLYKSYKNSWEKVTDFLANQAE